MPDGKSIVPRTPEPVVPERLEDAIRAYLSPVREGRSAVEDFEAMVARIRPESAPRVAALAAAYAVHLAQPVTREALDEWLEPLCDAVRGRPATGAAFQGYISALLAGGAELPLACLSPRAFAAAVRAFDWWPSAQKLIELLEDQASLLRSRQRAIEAVHERMKPAPIAVPLPPRQGPTEAQVEAVSQIVGSFTAELSARAASAGFEAQKDAKPPVKPHYLSPAVLAATLRQDIQTAGPQFQGALKRRLEVLERDYPEARLPSYTPAKAAE